MSAFSRFVLVLPLCLTHMAFATDRSIPGADEISEKRAPWEATFRNDVQFGASLGVAAVTGTNADALPMAGAEIGWRWGRTSVWVRGSLAMHPDLTLGSPSTTRVLVSPHVRYDFSRDQERYSVWVGAGASIGYVEIRPSSFSGGFLGAPSLSGPRFFVDSTVLTGDLSLGGTVWFGRNFGLQGQATLSLGGALGTTGVFGYSEGPVGALVSVGPQVRLPY